MNHSAGTPVAAEPGGARLVATLALAGLLSGLAIVSVYEVTLPRITANQARELREAIFRVVPGSVSMHKMVLQEGVLAEEEEEGGMEGVYAAYDAEGKLVGYAIPGEGPGFQDAIRLIYGYDPLRRLVVGMQVLESRETPGLGDKIIKDREFVATFDALAVDPEIVVVKKGAKSEANQVDAITGATISSKAVVRILNSTNRRWLDHLEPEKG